MMERFDRGVQIRMGEHSLRGWIVEIMQLVLDGDPLGTDDFASHRLPLKQAPPAYELFQRKQDEAVEVLLHP